MWWAQKTCFLLVLQVAGRVMMPLGASDKEYRRLAWNWSLGQEDPLKGREDPPCKEFSLGSANPRLLTWLVQTWVCGPDSQRPAAELSSSDPKPGNRRSFCTVRVKAAGGLSPLSCSASLESCGERDCFCPLPAGGAVGSTPTSSSTSLWALMGLMSRRAAAVGLRRWRS